MRLSSIVPVAAAILALGCGASDGWAPKILLPPPNGKPTDPPLTPDVANGVFRATIHGSAWHAEQIVRVTRRDGFLELSTTGTHVSEPMSVVLRIRESAGPGVYVLTQDGNGSSLVIALTDRVRAGSDFTWSTLYPETPMGSYTTGTATIALLTPNHIVGTFEGYLDTASGAAEMLMVQNGVFDITF